MAEDFTNEQLRDAAREAGISPLELREALAERAGVPARITGGGPQAALAMRVPAAVTAVRRGIEALSGRTGHAQGDDRHDIVDDEVGLTYRITGTDGGDGHSLVRVDVDTSAGKGALALAGAGVGGVALTVFFIGWLFSLTLLWMTGLGIGVLGGLLIGRSAMGLGRAKHRAEALAATALDTAGSGGDPPDRVLLPGVE